ncbi:hypothetical protein Tco_0519644 [Tanacetum coccineum]
MTTLAEHIIVTGAENYPPMLEKSINKYHSSRSSTDVYALLNHQEAAKDIWDRFASIQGETLYEYYWRFSQLINDMHTIGMTMQQVQANTKFINALPQEWSKFVINVKLAKSLYTTNYDQLYAYLSQHERHANEVRIMRERYLDPLALQGEDQIKCINKAIAFLSAMASRFPPSNNQLKMSSNPRNQATIQDGRVTVQQVQGRQTQSFAGTGNRGIATTSRGNYAWSRKQLAFITDPRIAGVQVTQQTISQNSAFQTEDLDAYDSDCDDISSAKAVLMANLSSCDSDVLSEESQNAGIQDTNSSAPNDLLVLSLIEQMTDHVANLDKEIRQIKW